MSRALFMAKLKEGLAGLPSPEIEEIASDYEFHFSEAAATGQSEDEVAAGLGDPARLARELLQDLEQRRGAGTAKSAGLPGSRRLLLLAGLLVLALAFGIFTILGAPGFRGRTDVGGAPASKIVISGEQALDLGGIAQDKLTVVIDGGAHVAAHGHVKELTLRLDGNGSADFQALQADKVQLDLSGTGNAEVTASQVADIAISGSGTVRLMARPTLLKQSVTGSGQVIVPAPAPK